MAIESDDPQAAAIWRRARRSMRHLFHDLADLADAGSLKNVAEAQSWSDGKIRRTIEMMRLLRRMLKTESDQFRADPEPNPQNPSDFSFDS